jgi:hypothetical protein
MATRRFRDCLYTLRATKIVARIPSPSVPLSKGEGSAKPLRLCSLSLRERVGVRVVKYVPVQLCHDLRLIPNFATASELPGCYHSAAQTFWPAKVSTCNPSRLSLQFPDHFFHFFTAFRVIILFARIQVFQKAKELSCMDHFFLSNVIQNLLG